jgi:hypothetical protein
MLDRQKTAPLDPAAIAGRALGDVAGFLAARLGA